jgi:hypothetical protein
MQVFFNNGKIASFTALKTQNDQGLYALSPAFE